jgi:hypothetical protein
MREFQPSDFSEFRSWHLERNVPAPPLELLSPTGLVEPGLAMGFVYLSPPLALCDCFVTSPSAPAQERKEALRSLALALFDLARDRGCLLVLGQTRLSPVHDLAEAVGARDLGPHSVWAKRL